MGYFWLGVSFYHFMSCDLELIRGSVGVVALDFPCSIVVFDSHGAVDLGVIERAYHYHVVGIQCAVAQCFRATAECDVCPHRAHGFPCRSGGTTSESTAVGLNLPQERHSLVPHS